MSGYVVGKRKDQNGNSSALRCKPQRRKKKLSMAFKTFLPEGPFQIIAILIGRRLSSSFLFNFISYENLRAIKI